MDPGVPRAGGKDSNSKRLQGAPESRGDPGLRLPLLQVREGEEEDKNRPALSPPQGPEPQV